MIPLILPPGILFKKAQKQKKQNIIKIKENVLSRRQIIAQSQH